MATVYSLICFAGLAGKPVTFTDAGDVVNLTSHGLRNTGNGVVFSTTGTLPTGLAAGTIYYARPGADANKFLLYPTSSDAIAGTNQVTFSGPGLGTHTVKSLKVTAPADLSRYGNARVYDSINSWNTARSGASKFDVEVAELGEAFDDIRASNTTLTIPASQMVITSMINGIRSEAFHNGVIGAGYVLKATGGGTALASAKYRIIINGFSVLATGNITGLSFSGALNTTQQMIIQGPGSGTGVGVSLQAALARLEGNIILGFSYGLSIAQYAYGATVANNLIVKCVNRGVYTSSGATTSIYGYYYNNIVIGCGINWHTQSAQVEGAACNAGLSTDAPWVTGGNPVISMTTSDFVDYTNNNFRPASVSSPQVDTGTPFYGIIGYDLADDEVPNYNNGGAEDVDVGCYEFDNGFGPHPASHTLTLTNVVVGSRVFIRDQANTTTHYDQIAAGPTVEITVTVYGDARDNWRIKIRKASAAPYYQAYETLMTAAAGSSSIYVNQLPN